MSADSLHRLATATLALGRMAEVFGYLPVTDVSVQTIYRDGQFGPAVVISVHDGLTDFEAWREALGIDTDDVKLSLLASAAALRAEAQWCGTWIEVHGYGPLPLTPEQQAGAVAA